MSETKTTVNLDLTIEKPVPFERVFEDVMLEVEHSTAHWPPYNSAHEAFAVLHEEVDELWDEVKVNQQRRSMKKMYREACQVAAVAIRFAAEIANEERGRK
jgi:spermidine synthase